MECRIGFQVNGTRLVLSAKTVRRSGTQWDSVRLSGIHEKTAFVSRSCP
jgi:hypothetical protein